MKLIFYGIYERAVIDIRADNIKDELELCPAGSLIFIYKREKGTIEKLETGNFRMYYGEKVEAYSSIDALLSAAFFDGKTFMDIHKKLELFMY